VNLHPKMQMGKKKRATPKCGVCGRKGHNRVSCRFRPEATIPSETDSSISNYAQEIYDDNEDWNVSLVCMKLLLYYFLTLHIVINFLN